jgi:hypothetical protein
MAPGSRPRRPHGLPRFRRAPAEYPDLHAFCLFVGYGRSGHSLVGSLLDAHPDVIVAHEANALVLAAQGFPRRDLLEALLENSRRHAERGRTQSGYSYAVEGQWQGRVRTLRVIGDKAGGRTARLISRDSTALRAFARTVHTPLRLIHVVRNPYDTVARSALVKTRDGVPKRSISEAIEQYDVLVRTVSELVDRSRHPLITVRHESLIEDPRRELRRLCEFVGVEAEDGHLDACAAIVFTSPRRTRDRVEWRQEELEAVDATIAQYEFLAGYSWDA